LDADELDVEHERGVRWDRAAAAGPVGQLGRGGQLALAADAHALDAEVPSFDHLARPEQELDRQAGVVRAVELVAAGDPPEVVRGDDLSGGRGRAAPDPQVLDGDAADVPRRRL